MTDGTTDLPGLITRVDTKEQAAASRRPNLSPWVRAFLSSSPALGFRPIPPSGGTTRLKSTLTLMVELSSFHWSGTFRESPLSRWHRTQALTIESRWAHLALPWLALASWAASGLKTPGKRVYGAPLARIAARYDLPKRSKTPRPL